MKTILRSDIEKAWADKKAGVGEIIHFLDFTEEQVNKALERQRQLDAEIARNPYGDLVQAYGNDQPQAVGNKIAQAILAQA